jgi:hypothetical protein
MRFVYLSTDELNRGFVRAWASRHDIEVECLTRSDRIVASAVDAILLDLDHLPPAWPEESLVRLSTGGPMRAAAAHGYGPYAEELRGRGLTVHPRLCSQALRLLAQAAATSARAREIAHQLTWVNLA